MKIDFVKTIIAIAVSSLIAYGFYTFNASSNESLLAVGSLIFSITTLTLAIGINFDLPRTTTLIRTVSVIFFVVSILSNLFFSFVVFKTGLYIIINGILFLIYGLTAYSIGKAKQ